MNNAEGIRISVVIPFYQKEKGILSKSLQSVFLQSEPQYISEIIVVDDGSPCPAEPEVSDIQAKFNHAISIKLIKQDNAGVSKARNKALDNVAESCTHIAFLDSDDRWEPDHIKYAVKAIRLGAKFYFSNFYQLNSKVPAFQKSSNFDLASSKQRDSHIYQYNKCFINQIVVSNPIGTPTVVYEKAGTENIRFDKKYRYAGEDYMMWVALTRQLKDVYFCSEPTVVCDAGVNIFSGAMWGSLHLSNRLIDEIAYKTDMLIFPELNPEVRGLTLDKIKTLRKSLFKNTLSRLARFQFSGLIKVVSILMNRS